MLPPASSCLKNSHPQIFLNQLSRVTRLFSLSSLTAVSLSIWIIQASICELIMFVMFTRNIDFKVTLKIVVPERVGETFWE